MNERKQAILKLLDRDKININHSGIGLWVLGMFIFFAVAEYNSHWEMIEKCKLLDQCQELANHD